MAGLTLEDKVFKYHVGDYFIPSGHMPHPDMWKRMMVDWKINFIDRVGTWL